MTHLTRPTLRSLIHFLVLIAVAFGATGCLRHRGQPTHLRLDRSALLAPAVTPLASSTTGPPAREVQPIVFEEPVAPEEEGTPAAVEVPERECPAEGTRVLLIGDSLSHGLGPAMRPLAQACGTVYFHHGVIGSHVTQWQQDGWLGRQLRRARPTVVMMSMGGNDFQRFDPENVTPAIERVIAAVEASGARFLWISPPTMPFSDRIDVRGMWADALSAHPATATYPTEQLAIPRVADRVHPTPAANRDLAQTLWTWMANLEAR